MTSPDIGSAEVVRRPGWIDLSSSPSFDESELVDRLARRTGRDGGVFGIDFSGTGLTDDGLLRVADLIARLSALRALRFAGTKLTDSSAQALATIIAACAEVEELDLSFTKIGDTVCEAVLTSPTQCRLLQSLDISGTRVRGAGLLRWISRNDGVLQLRVLRAGYTAMTAMAMKALLGALARGGATRLLILQGAHVSDSELATFFRDESSCAALRTLDLAGTCVSSDLFVSVHKRNLTLAALKDLTVRNTYFTDAGATAIGMSAMNLRQLEHFDCSQNAVSDGGFASWVGASGRFLKLRHIDLRQTEVTTETLRLIGAARECFPRLRTIALEATGCHDIATEILRTGDVDLLLDAAVNGVPLNEAKLIVVGEGRVGKTSICRRLVRSAVPFSLEEPETDSFEIHDWSAASSDQPSGSTDSSHVSQSGPTVRAFDFGGQEILHAIHRMFFTERAVYLLVCDGSQNISTSTLDYWLALIKHYAARAPIIVAVTKADLGQSHSYTSLTAVDLARRSGSNVVEVISGLSARNEAADRNISLRLRPVIQRALRDAPSVNERVGAEFDALRSHLLIAANHAAMEPLDHFDRVASDLGVSSPIKRRRYLELLHEFATIFHWGVVEGQATLNEAQPGRQRAPLRLASVTFRPKWIRDCVYSVLRDTALDASSGLVRREEVARVLASNALSVKARFSLHDVVDVVIAVMSYCELCFVMDDGHRVLLPARLPAVRPDVGEWGTQSTVARFNFLPESVCQRFIVRMCEARRIKGNCYWRHGAVIYHFGMPGCLALIEYPPGRPEIVVRTRGGSPAARKELEAVVQHEIEAIHSPIGRVWVSESPWTYASADLIEEPEQRGVRRDAGTMAATARTAIEGVPTMSEFVLSNGAEGEYARDTAVAELKHVQGLLDLVTERIRYLERQEMLTDGEVQRVAIQQQLAHELRPRKWRLESRWADALGRAGAVDAVSHREAAAVIEGLGKVIDVVTVDAQATLPAVRSELDRLRSVVGNAEKTATAKLKVSLPIIPLIASYDLEIDSERALEEIWARVLRLFGRSQP